MKRINFVFALLMVLAASTLIAQPTIVTDVGSYTTGQSSSVLDVYSTTRGMLVPRMTATQKDAISSPATGLLIYQTDGTAGFYYYDGISWTPFTTGASSGYLKADGTTSLTGNLRLNNQYLSNDGGDEGLRVDNSGNVYIGGANSNYLFFVKTTTGNQTIGTQVSTTSGNNYGVFAQVDGVSSTDSVGNYGVYGLATGKTGSGSENFGVYGNSTGAGTYNFGVNGKSTVGGGAGTYNYGVNGLASGNSNYNVGVWGESEGNGSFNAGVAGRAQTAGTTNYGMYGGAYGNLVNYAVYGYATGGTTNYAVYGNATGTNPYSFYGGAGTLYNAGNVGIGSGASSPNSILQVSGSVSLPITTKTSGYTATSSDHTIIGNPSGSNITITLPAASGISGRIYVIKNISGTDQVVINGNAAETIDGSATYTTSAQYESITIQCDGTGWHIISKF